MFIFKCFRVRFVLQSKEEMHVLSFFLEIILQIATCPGNIMYNVTLEHFDCNTAEYLS